MQLGKRGMRQQQFIERDLQPFRNSRHIVPGGTCLARKVSGELLPVEAEFPAQLRNGAVMGGDETEVLRKAGRHTWHCLNSALTIAPLQVA